MTETPKAKRERVQVGPQAGPQEAFLFSKADIAIYGGAAGGGKSAGLLLEALRHHKRIGFKAMIFRRNANQVTNPGGLWDESEKFFAPFGSRALRHRLQHTFPGGATVKFAHLERDKTVQAYQGSQIALIGYDELTHFTAKQFFYMLSRNRSLCGVKPYIRATTNPDPDSWVASFIAWWIDQRETLANGSRNPEWGQPIAERAGKLRWFIRVGDELVWADTAEELRKRKKDSQPKSVTFIPAKVTDNRILMETDPGYVANLEALPYVDRMRLLGGNWKIRAVAGLFFKREWFPIVDVAPKLHISTIRYWDRAATEPTVEDPDPDWCAGVKVTRDQKGVFYVEHVARFQGTPGKVERNVVNIASQDGINCAVGIEQDPGSAGKSEAANYIRLLVGYNVKAYPATKAKDIRAKPASAQAEARNICLVRGPWNEAFLSELEAFPCGEEGNDDQVDGLAGAINALADITPSAVKVMKDKNPNRVPMNLRDRKGKTLI